MASESKLPAGITSERQSPQDLCITFEVNGEKYTFCIGTEAMKNKSKADLIKVMNDTFTCTICCSQKSGFALCMARCVEGDGKCCDDGARNCD